ncbi:hypothetical protein P5673_001075 [Acropora cervicornis]|uniref:Uncharacterized protein n=1 Tax=Acropora cervicornis TaxID=6130 RepID=A0AAD9VGB5_ACRCE|nr:hypothetical protein P5673_001075 [Acropora cervicornis]
MVLRNTHVFKVAWVRLRDQRTCLGGEQAALSEKKKNKEGPLKFNDWIKMSGRWIYEQESGYIGGLSEITGDHEGGTQANG